MATPSKHGLEIDRAEHHRTRYSRYLMVMEDGAILHKMAWENKGGHWTLGCRSRLPESLRHPGVAQAILAKIDTICKVKGRAELAALVEAELASAAQAAGAGESAQAGNHAS